MWQGDGSPVVGGLVGKLSDASGFSRFLIPRVLYKTTISPGQGIDMSEFQLSGIETPPINMCTKRRKVRLIEGNSKCRHLKNWPVDVQCGRCLSGPEPPPPLTHCGRVYTIQYTYSHSEGGEGLRDEPERRLDGQQFTKLGRKYQHVTDFISNLSTPINICRKVPLQVHFFGWQHFALVSI